MLNLIVDLVNVSVKAILVRCGYNNLMFYIYGVYIFAVLCADSLLTMKASPPPEEDFVNIFQKIKYSFSLLVWLDYVIFKHKEISLINTNNKIYFFQDRLKSYISQPNAPELLHHIFVPLRLVRSHLVLFLLFLFLWSLL